MQGAVCAAGVAYETVKLTASERWEMAERAAARRRRLEAQALADLHEIRRLRNALERITALELARKEQPGITNGELLIRATTIADEVLRG